MLRIGDWQIANCRRSIQKTHGMIQSEGGRAQSYFYQLRQGVRKGWAELVLAFSDAKMISAARILILRDNPCNGQLFEETSKNKGLSRFIEAVQELGLQGLLIEQLPEP